MHEHGLKVGADKGGMLLVWDADGLPPFGGDSTKVLWREYASPEDPTVISIPQLVEQQAGELRSRYLAWIHDLGETRISGKTVINHLLLRPGFSYWWMGSLAQKFNASGTSHIDDAIKALALEMLATERQVASIVLVSGNRQLGTCVQHFCSARGIGYSWCPVKASAKKSNRRQLYQSLAPSWRAFIYLAWYTLNSIPLALQRRSIAPNQVGDVLFVDVLVHLDKRASSTGRFISNYWSTLVEKLAQWGVRSNWLHNYYRHPATPSPAQAQELIDRFNKSSNGSQFHALVERSMSLRLVIRVVRDYLRVRQSMTRLHQIRDVRSPGSDIDLWPLHSEDWIDSLCGKNAMISCLRLSLIEDALGRFPTQKLGVYIAENQPWEMALVHAWKTAGHGALIGTPHTTVRFWDLRYHYDSRTYLGSDGPGLPLPDILGVNGPVARECVLAGGYPPQRVRDVEALRFSHLLWPEAVNISDRRAGHPLRMLVCGDFLQETNARLLAWLEVAAQSLPLDTVYVFKPHPAQPLISTAFPKIKLNIKEEPLPDLLADCDLVFTSNITSAAVDAYCAGVSVIQMLEGGSFNMSPLRGLKDVVYVTNPAELAETIRTTPMRSGKVYKPYFFLNEALPFWRDVLKLNADGISE